MSEENRSTAPLTQMQITILDRMMDLRRRGLVLRFIVPNPITTTLAWGDRILPWVPEVILMMEVYLALWDRERDVRALEKGRQEVNAGKRDAVWVRPSMDFERFDLQLQEFLEDGYLEASDGEDAQARVEAHPQLLPPYRHAGDGRTVTFATLKFSAWRVVRALVDGEQVWTRKYRSFPTTSYRLTPKGREAWADASAQANTPSDKIELEKDTYYPLGYLMRALHIPKDKKGKLEQRVNRWRKGHRGHVGYEEKKLSRGGQVRYRYLPGVVRDQAKDL